MPSTIPFTFSQLPHQYKHIFTGLGIRNRNKYVGNIMHCENLYKPETLSSRLEYTAVIDEFGSITIVANCCTTVRQRPTVFSTLTCSHRTPSIIITVSAIFRICGCHRRSTTAAFMFSLHSHTYCRVHIAYDRPVALLYRSSVY